MGSEGEAFRVAVELVDGNPPKAARGSRRKKAATAKVAEPAAVVA